MVTDTNTNGNMDTHTNTITNNSSNVNNNSGRNEDDNIDSTNNNNMMEGDGNEVDAEQAKRKWRVQKLPNGTFRFGLGGDGTFHGPCVFLKIADMDFQMITCHCTGGDVNDRKKTRAAYKACEAEGKRRYNLWLRENGGDEA